MIPALFHRIWFGSKPIPAQYEAWWNAWKRQYPSHEFRTWTDKDIPNLKSVSERIANADSMARKSDIARYEILGRFGGIYLDCDIMPLNYYDFSRETSDLVVCHERDDETHNCQNAFIAVSQGHPIMDMAIEKVCNIPEYRGDIILETGPGFFKALLNITDYKMLHSSAFYPYLYNQSFSSIFNKDISRTYGIHVWGNSWFSAEMMLQKLTSMFYSGDIIDIETFTTAQLRDNDIYFYVLDYVGKLRGAREAIVKFATSDLAAGALHCEDGLCFELFKTCYYLLKKNPNATIWHVGAGDGLTNDKLRPILINFDPHAILIEANNYAYRELRNNYKNNTNTVFLNAALGPDKATVNFYAVNYDKARRLGLKNEFLRHSSLCVDESSMLGRMSYEPVAKSALLKCLERHSIDMINPDYLCSITGHSGVNVLVIDVDINVYSIISAAIKCQTIPEIIYFNSAGLPATELLDITNMLSNKYKICPYDGHSIAYSAEFHTEYCNNLFINHGLSTIFGKAIDVVAIGAGRGGGKPPRSTL